VIFSRTPVSFPTFGNEKGRASLGRTGLIYARTNMFTIEHTFPEHADGTLQDGSYFGAHPRSPPDSQAQGCGASGPASEPSDSAASRRHGRRVGGRGPVRRSRRVGGRLGLGGRVVIAVAIPIAAATTGLETVGDHT